MTQLAALVSKLWRAAQACAWLACVTGSLSWLGSWACVLYTASAALAWSLTWAGGRIVWLAL